MKKKAQKVEQEIKIQDKRDNDEVVRGRKGGKMLLKGVIIKRTRERKQRGKMKGWLLGFPTTLQLTKPEKDNCVVNMRAAHSEIRNIQTQQGQPDIQNKSNTQSYRSIVEGGRDREQERENTAEKINPQKFHKCFLFSIVVSLWQVPPLDLLFHVVCVE